jgi:hypothetical protein
MGTRIAVALLLALLALSSPVSASPALSPIDKAALHAAMHKAIDRAMVGQSYLHFDAGRKEVTPLFPAKAHPMILRMGEYFVLCTDFRDEKGKSVNVDFYVARSNKAFVVFHMAIDNRKVLDEMMAVGKVTIVE